MRIAGLASAGLKNQAGGGRFARALRSKMSVGVTCLLDLRQWSCAEEKNSPRIARRKMKSFAEKFGIKCSDVPQPCAVTRVTGRLKRLAKPQAAIGSYSARERECADVPSAVGRALKNDRVFQHSLGPLVPRPVLKNLMSLSPRDSQMWGRRKARPAARSAPGAAKKNTENFSGEGNNLPSWRI